MTAPSSESEKKVVEVRLEDRARLMSAVLAATNYPDKSQERRKHGTHAHARATRKMLADYTSHPAVHALQVLLDQGVSLTAVYTYAMRLTFPNLEAYIEPPRWVPPRWHEHLRHFYEQTRLEQWWNDEAPHWDTPLRHLSEAFAKVDMYTFFEPFVGQVMERFVFLPNICYPSDQTLGFRVGSELYTLMPPPIAWGDSPPWPYKDDPALAYRSAIAEYGKLLLSAYLQQHAEVIQTISDKPLPIDDKYAELHPSWQAQLLGLLIAALTALFLEDSVSALEAKSFLINMQKVENLTVLPGVVAVIRRYLEDYQAGRFTSFAEFLPKFPQHLRVAKTITAL
ncbi:MAG: hypothetical protein OHK0023_01890 [Anaerolineae bacterium]